MKVIALKEGFYDSIRRREGALFDFKGDKPAKWMKPVEAAEAMPAAQPVEAAEATLSEISRRGHAVEVDGIRRKSAKA